MTTVLIADDHKFFRTGVSAMLGAAGIDVVSSVGDGDAALEAIVEANPDMVILDIRMPGLDGVATLNELRRQGDERPVIVLATELKDDQLVAIMSAGVNAILFKDGAEEALLEAIEAVRSGKRYIDGAILDRAFRLAVNGGERQPVALSMLAARELEVAAAVAEGKRNREVADELGMTEGTVKVFLHIIYAKLGIGNRTELALMMSRHSKPVDANKRA